MGNAVQKPSGVVATNIKRWREAHGLSQQAVAERMSELGFRWTHSVASDFERGRRGVSIDELVHLALLFGIEPGKLLRAEVTAGVALGSGDQALSAAFYNLWLDGRVKVAFAPPVLDREGPPEFRLMVNPLDPDARQLIELLWNEDSQEEDD
jgi:transcriptional regulator with XRE-family HTH domain